MIPYWHDAFLTVYEGDCREVMAQMEPESVHCVVTSPPYWGLRDYGTATWLGGDDGCDHKAPPTGGPNPERYTPGGGEMFRQANDKTYDRTCRKCGAIRQDSQLGLEPTPEEYVENMVAVFREVKRVLRKDGTCWVNLGDSYVAGQGGRQSSVGEMPAKPLYSAADPRKRSDVDTGSWGERDATAKMTPARGTTTLKPKDLVGIPWRVAFALQADGWYLRSDIIWSKPNPMPESVTDRPTKAHEYLFLLTKSPRYYYDADAVREPAEYGRRNETATWHEKADSNMAGVRVASTTSGSDPSAGRNLRTVWTIATQPYPGAHFATFPEALVEPCVKAGTSERGVCPECGAPWVREVERRTTAPTYRHGNRPETTHAVHGESDTRTLAMVQEVTTTGWRPSCVHRLNSAVTWDDPAFAGVNRDEPSPVPATVLDPFAGSGTTGRVAQRLGRKAVLIDLSGEYLQQLMVRNADIPLGLAEGSGR